MLYQRTFLLYPQNLSDSAKEYFLKNFTTAEDNKIKIKKGKFELPKELSTITIEEQMMPGAFDFVWNNWNRTLPFLRMTQCGYVLNPNFFEISLELAYNVGNL